MTDSLQARLLWAGAIVLGLALLGTGLALDLAFRESAVAAQQERLRGHAYTLLAALSVDTAAIAVDAPLPEPRFARPRSGLYAWVVTPDDGAVWRSRSTRGAARPAPRPVAPGAVVNRTVDGHFRLQYGVSWEEPGQPMRRFTLVIEEDAAAVNGQVAAFRRTLWGWLLGGVLVSLLALTFTLRRTLSPLRRVAADLDHMERGRRSHLPDDYPAEIRRLTRSINHRIDAERARGERFRRNLDDLAHSLKTPLAVLRTALASADAGSRHEASDQLDRINASLDYHVRRGGAGTAAAGTGVAVLPVARRLADALGKVHADRGLALDITGADAATVAVGEDDLMELLGNLMDNACKWARSSVTVTIAEPAGEPPRVAITVTDDGPGIPPARRVAVLERGTRDDESVPGEGIGLSVVQAVIDACGGDLWIDDATGGGTRVVARLPAR